MAKKSKTKKKKKKLSKKKTSKKKTKKSVKSVEPEIIEAAPSSGKELAPATDAVSQYLQEIRHYPLLSKEEEKELAVKYYETGDREAAEKLVTSNLRFVVKVASEYSKFGAKLIDLIQEGNVGLMHAVKEFNPYKGVKLITYAVWWIRGYIQEYLMRQYSLVRIGTTQNQRKLYYQLQKHREELERLGHEAGVALLSGKLDVSEKEVKEMTQRMSGKDISLDQTVGDENSSTLLDLQKDEYEIQVDDQIAQHEQINLLNKNIEDLRESLNDKEKYILDTRLLSDEPKTLQEIGTEWKVTREAVRQMEARVVKKLKERMVGDSSQ